MYKLIVSVNTVYIIMKILFLFQNTQLSKALIHLSSPFHLTSESIENDSIENMIVAEYNVART